MRLLACSFLIGLGSREEDLTYVCRGSRDILPRQQPHSTNEGTREDQIQPKYLFQSGV
jgi:hypothetical protein